jgi:hypothetical protein
MQILKETSDKDYEKYCEFKDLMIFNMDLAN